MVKGAVVHRALECMCALFHGIPRVSGSGLMHFIALTELSERHWNGLGVY